MKFQFIQAGAALALSVAFTAHSAVLYVNVNGATPTPPYADWNSAATNIQDAVNAASPGDEVLVTNGVYAFGSTLASDGTSNRVTVTIPITLESVNGAAVTAIDGGGTLRCLYLTNGSTLTGFTLTNGKAGNGGGLYCTSTNVFVANCTMISNNASSGGGVYSGTLTNCTMSGNNCFGTGGNGGGAAWSTLYNCTLSGNTTGTAYPGTSGASWGGGANACKLYDCTLSGNSSYGAGASGGGAGNPTTTPSVSTLNNCWLVNNHSDDQGGGAGASYLTNCLLTGNSATLGGGATESILENCTVSGYNSAAGGNTGAGTYYCTANNCIIYFNIPGNNTSSTLNYCCTPDAGAAGCFTNAPQFVNPAGNDYHLGNFSPCINGGNNGYVVDPTDLDGNPRIVGGTVDVGAYENQSATAASGLPAVPTNLSAYYTGGHVVLTWAASAKATSYNVYRAITGGGTFTNIANAPTTNYSDGAIVNGGTYYYYVTAVNAYGESIGSPQAIAFIVDHFAFATIPSPQTASVPFTITISACDSGGNVLGNFTGATMLSAAGDHGGESISPSNTTAFVNGQWTGSLTLDSSCPDTDIRVSANTNGVSGISNPFNAVAPAIQEFNLTLADVGYDTFNQMFYATVPAAAGVYSNCLIAIDPVLGRVVNSFYLGDDPEHLSVSADGHFVYLTFNGTNVFRRFNLASNSVDMQVPLPGASGSIAALPGLPHSVAVSSGGVAIFDDAVQRSNTYSLGGLVVAGSAEELYTSGGGYPIAPFARLDVDATGVTNYTYVNGIVGVNDTFTTQGGLVFTSEGVVFNPETAEVLGQLTNCSIAEPDLAAGTIFSMGSHPVFASPDAWTLYAWNSTNLQLTSSLPIPGVNPGGPTTLIRWGTNGIAFSISSWYISQFYLVRNAMVPSVPPSQVQAGRLVNGVFQLNFQGDQGIPYTIWATSNFMDWTAIGVPNLVSNGLFWSSDSNAASYSNRFYRVGITH